MSGFNEKECARYIRQAIGEATSAKYTEDDLLYIVDLIWDYYDKKGLLSLSDFNDDDDEELLDEDELIKEIKKTLKENPEDAELYDPADIAPIVLAELKYEESLEDII